MNIFKQLFLSLYSPKSIALWRNQGIGKTILFVFLLTLISVLPTAIYFSTALTGGLQAVQQSLEQNIPDFTIDNGQLHADEAVTLENEGFTIIFEPTGATEWDNISGSSNAIAFLKNEFVVSGGGTVEHFPYSTLGDMTISKADVLQFVEALDSLLAVILPIFFIIIYLFSSAMKFIGISVLALIGLLFNKQGADELKYRHLWRLAAYSITLPTIFFTVMDFFQTAVPFGFFLNWFVSILVLVLTLKEIPKTKETLQ